MKTLRSGLVSRLLFVYFLLACWSILLFSRLFSLQVLERDKYRLLADQQRIGFVELSHRRGDILDRHLEELAISVQMDSVFAHPHQLRDPIETAEAMAPILGQEKEELYKKLISKPPFVYLARKIPPQQAAQIRKLKLAGIGFQQEGKRVYPNREMAAHVLGFAGLDNEGLSGLEYHYNHFLKGKKTMVPVRMDALRQSYGSDSVPNPSQGHILVLTIDKSIQYIAEQVLQATMSSSRALSGSVIVMDPHSGEVLAMASYPSFNPNRYSDYSEEMRRNRAILEIYEPGSTFKIITAAAVLNEGLAQPSETIDCRVGTLRLAGKVYGEAKRSFGMLTFNEIVARSSNVGTIKLALRLGEEKLYRYIRRFGFGEKTKIDLPGEQSGLLRPPSRWSRISIGALSIGQEIGVTPLQTLRALAATANGGYLVKPQLVRRVLSAQGDILHSPRQERMRILHPATTAKMKDVLRLVVEEGTGRSIQLSGYSSGGKTGTAQKFIDGSYSDRKFIASYAGFAPLDNPALATVVVINEPEGKYYGAEVAGPAFKQIMERCLIHLRIPKDRPVPLELVRSQDISTTEVDELPPKGLEETVQALMEQENAASEAHHVVTLQVGSFALPAFSGLSLREVVRECKRLGLRLKVSGSGLAVGQRPRAGTQVFEDTVCEVFFTPVPKQQQNQNHASAKTAFKSGRQPENPH